MPCQMQWHCRFGCEDRYGSRVSIGKIYRVEMMGFSFPLPITRYLFPLIITPNSLFNIKHKEIICTLADPRGAGDTPGPPPPFLGPISFSFMEFSAKPLLKIGFCSKIRGWHPPVRKIVDPPLMYFIDLL